MKPISLLSKFARTIGFFVSSLKYVWLSIHIDPTKACFVTCKRLSEKLDKECKSNPISNVSVKQYCFYPAPIYNHSERIGIIILVENLFSCHSLLRKHVIYGYYSTLCYIVSHYTLHIFTNTACLYIELYATTLQKLFHLIGQLCMQFWSFLVHWNHITMDCYFRYVMILKWAYKLCYRSVGS